MPDEPKETWGWWVHPTVFTVAWAILLAAILTESPGWLRLLVSAVALTFAIRQMWSGARLWLYGLALLGLMLVDCCVDSWRLDQLIARVSRQVLDTERRETAAAFYDYLLRDRRRQGAM